MGTSTSGFSFANDASFDHDMEEENPEDDPAYIVFPPGGNNTVSETTYPLTDVDGTETLY
ncbi:hypothetical protein KIPB_015212, partial [Kipferlia bialata]|eukprot:g15212.t1